MGAGAVLIRRSLPILALAGVAAGAGGCAGGPAARPVTLATTTTIEDSGLLDAWVRAFRAAHPEVALRVVTGGTGEVLALGRRGDVDVIVSHDPAAESAFVALGHGVERRELMHNDFVIAGPASDPARIRGVTDAVQALGAIAARGAPFVSRGDDLGTHRKERELWSAVSSPPPGAAAVPAERWYLEAGVGMADALRLASERRAYLLTDRATYLVLRDGLDLEILVEGDPRLVNRYGVTLVRSAANPEDARVVADWLVSPEGRAVTGGHGAGRYGGPLFVPAAPPR